MAMPELILGIDGGGSKTTAWLSSVEGGAENRPLGQGRAGPSNPQSVGWETALENLDRAVDTAFADAGITPRPLAAACIALAGGDRENVRLRLRQWADRRDLARSFLATHDALPLLAAGTPQGVGIAIVSGTGSFAFGRTGDGATLRSGGWGYLFGDEGSGYNIALEGLRAAARAHDGRGEQTLLSELLLQELQLDSAAELIPEIYARAQQRRWLASLARLVFVAAERNDSAACLIVTAAAVELAEMAVAVARRLGFEHNRFPLALGGGAMIHSAHLREQLLKQLSEKEFHPEPVSVVPEPVAGAVICARELLGGS